MLGPAGVVPPLTTSWKSPMQLQEIEEAIIDDRFKGIPGGVSPFPLKAIGDHGWNVLRGDMPLPLAVLKQEVLEHNSRWMRRFLEATGAVISPHGKTTMSPQLYAQQLKDGAWGITLATVGQVQIARRFGVRRILLANQLVGPAAIDSIAGELSRDDTFTFLCLVDSVPGVTALAERLQKHRLARPLEVLVEGGIAGQRCGCRTVDEALAVARAVRQAAPVLRLRGVEGFEGSVAANTLQEKEAQVRHFITFLVQIAEACSREQLFADDGPVILSAGGSAYYDIVVDEFRNASLERDVQIIIRSGCYLTHDSGMYERLQERLLERSPAARSLGPSLEAALEVWSYVQSRPEPSRVVLTMGKRDCSFDVAMPQPTRWFRPGAHDRPQPLEIPSTAVRLNDQHAMIDVDPTSPLAVGDMVACGISHPCTTFDRWQLIPVVDQQYNVVSAIRTFF